MSDQKPAFDPSSEAAYLASIWGLSTPRLQVLTDTIRKAFTAGQSADRAELTALRQRVVEVVGKLLLHSGIADVTDEDKFPEDIEAERAARALVNEMETTK